MDERSERRSGRRMVQGVGTFRGPLLPSRRREGVPASLQRYTGFVLIVVADVIETTYSRATYQLGFSLRDFVLMAEIAQRPGLSQGALAERVGLGRSRVSEQLAVLDTAGYVDREMDIVDLRRRRIWVTSEGRLALEDATERLTQIDRGLLTDLTPHDRHHFTASLRRLAPTSTGRLPWVAT
jgi:DNA-binding MarR family transcriptional regulator